MEKRLELFDLMAGILEGFQLPIFFQTSSPEFMQEARPRLEAALGPEARLGMLNLFRHEHFSLTLLLVHIRQFLRTLPDAFPDPLPVVVDEGIAKSGVTIEVPAWRDLFAQGRITFRKSDEVPFLQIADFAAFCLGRQQWLLAKESLQPQDALFLRTISADRFNIINLPTAAISVDRHTGADYDRRIRDDRVEKGLPPNCPENQ
jgi:hypothetical protein